MNLRIDSARFAAAVPWPWLAAFVVVTLVSLGGYAGVQQVLRNLANDPQVQLAEDAAARLADGAAPRDVLPGGRVAMAGSLAPWVAVVRDGGGVLASSGQLDGRMPVPPAGVLGIAERAGEDVVTWRPARHTRIALVAAAVPGRPGLVVLAGRSLRLVEERVDRIGRLFLLAWGGAVGVVASAWALSAWGRTAPLADR